MEPSILCGGAYVSFAYGVYFFSIRELTALEEKLWEYSVSFYVSELIVSINFLQTWVGVD